MANFHDGRNRLAEGCPDAMRLIRLISGAPKIRWSSFRYVFERARMHYAHSLLEESFRNLARPTSLAYRWKADHQRELLVHIEQQPPIVVAAGGYASVEGLNPQGSLDVLHDVLGMPRHHPIAAVALRNQRAVAKRLECWLELVHVADSLSWVAGHPLKVSSSSKRFRRARQSAQVIQFPSPQPDGDRASDTAAGSVSMGCNSRDQ